MAKKEIYDASKPPGRIAYFLVLHILRLLTVVFLRAQIKINPEIRKLTGPVIALSNHPSFLDPVFMAKSFWPRKVHFLTASTFYRLPLARQLMQALRTIPKIQFRSDARALKHMLKIIRANGVIGIFPEGQRSIDGSMQPIDDSISKFIKKTGCAVVVVRVQGAYASWPRWSNSMLRRGRIEVTSHILFRPEQLADLNVQEIQHRIRNSLDYNEYNWQKQKRYRFWSLAPASGLHNLCHKCPSCHQDLAMRSGLFRLSCRQCGFSLKVDQKGFFHLRKPGRQKSLSEADLPVSPYDLHQWQIRQLTEIFQTPGYTIRQTADVYQVNPEDGHGIKLCHGTLLINLNEMCFLPDQEHEQINKCFPIHRKTGLSAHFGMHFEYAHGDDLYRFIPDNGQSVILLVDAIRAIQALPAHMPVTNAC